MSEQLILDDLVDELNIGIMRFVFTVCMKAFNPKKIIRSGDVTVVFWGDDSKTIVRCQKEDLDDDYTAFCAALGKKIFGSNSALKKVIKRCLTIQQKTKYRMKREREEAEVAKLKDISAEGGMA